MLRNVFNSVNEYRTDPCLKKECNLFWYNKKQNMMKYSTTILACPLIPIPPPFHSVIRTHHCSELKATPIPSLDLAQTLTLCFTLTLPYPKYNQSPNPNPNSNCKHSPSHRPSPSHNPNHNTNPNPYPKATLTLNIPLTPTLKNKKI
jgi:hypothetical protein